MSACLKNVSACEPLDERADRGVCIFDPNSYVCRPITCITAARLEECASPNGRKTAECLRSIEPYIITRFDFGSTKYGIDEPKRRLGGRESAPKLDCWIDLLVLSDHSLGSWPAIALTSRVVESSVSYHVEHQHLQTAIEQSVRHTDPTWTTPDDNTQFGHFTLTTSFC